MGYQIYELINDFGCMEVHRGIMQLLFKCRVFFSFYGAP